MKHILIPTDFSENAWNAIEYALHFFSKSACSFYLLHVETPASLQDQDDVNTSIASKTKIESPKIRLQDTLSRINERFSLNVNHKFFPIVDNNFIIDSIRTQVAEKKIDFIVMGTKGASGLKKITIGNNAGNVITKVKCTTLVVPENAKFENLKEIAFPTDFSLFYPTQTLQPIIDIVEENMSAVRVAYLNKNGVGLNEDQKKNKEFLDDYFIGKQHSFHSLTDAHVEDAMQNFVESQGVNLITMLAKNLNYFQKILFHPSIPKISYYTDIPFLVLH
ncbi:MAG: universal stress protein [Algibacter sp.]